jgi:hypothetical protein
MTGGYFRLWQFHVGSWQKLTGHGFKGRTSLTDAVEKVFLHS